MLEVALTSFILAQTEITAHISDRFGFDSLPLGTDYPYLIAQCVSDIKEHTHDGQDGTESPIYQLTVFAANRLTAQTIAELIKTAFCDFQGTMSGLDIQYITLLNELPNTLTTADGTSSAYIVALEYKIVYNRR